MIPRMFADAKCTWERGRPARWWERSSCADLLEELRRTVKSNGEQVGAARFALKRSVQASRLRSQAKHGCESWSIVLVFPLSAGKAPIAVLFCSHKAAWPAKGSPLK